MSLAVVIEELDSCSAAVTLTGPLILGSNLRSLEEQLAALVARGRIRLLLDLTEVPYVDSSGLGLVVRAHGRAKEKGGAVRLCGVSAKIAELFALTSTDTFLVVDFDRETSLDALRQGLRG